MSNERELSELYCLNHITNEYGKQCRKCKADKYNSLCEGFNPIVLRTYHTRQTKPQDSYDRGHQDDKGDRGHDLIPSLAVNEDKTADTLRGSSTYHSRQETIDGALIGSTEGASSGDARQSHPADTLDSFEYLGKYVAEPLITDEQVIGIGAITEGNPILKALREGR